MSEKGELHQAAPILPCRDIEKSISFYEQQLGFKTVFKYDDYVGLARDSVSIHLFKFDDLNPLENYGMCYIYVTNIAILFEEYQAKGVIHPNAPLEAKSWGMQEFAVLDPDNNLIRVGETLLN